MFLFSSPVSVLPQFQAIKQYLTHLLFAEFISNKSSQTYKDLVTV